MKQYVSVNKRIGDIKDAINELAEAVENIAWQTGCAKYNKIAKRIRIQLKNVEREYIEV